MSSLLKPLIRIAQASDAQNLAALAIQVWLHTYAYSGINASLSRYVLTEFSVEKFQQLIAATDKCVLVAEINDHLVAYAVLKFDAARDDVIDTSTELATLYVQEHFTRREIGSALLAACAEQAQQRCGNPGFWLIVNHQNSRAISFYQQSGYAQCGIFYFNLDGNLHKNLVMAKPKK